MTKGIKKVPKSHSKSKIKVTDVAPPTHEQLSLFIKKSKEGSEIKIKIERNAPQLTRAHNLKSKIGLAFFAVIAWQCITGQHALDWHEVLTITHQLLF